MFSEFSRIPEVFDEVYDAPTRNEIKTFLWVLRKRIHILIIASDQYFLGNML